MRINNLLPLLAFLIVTVITSSTVMAANKKASQSNEKETNSILRISCTDSNEGAVVSINGKVKGECPFDTQVPAGNITVSAKKTSADGAYEQVFEKEMVMGEGIVKKIEVVLTTRLTAIGQKREDERLVLEQAEQSKIDAVIAGADFIKMVSIPGKNYEIGKYEITQGQWKTLMGSNPSHFNNCGDDCPVEKVSRNDVQEFIQKLNAKTGKQYRLPSESEWENACRAGAQQEYCGSDNIDAVAWYTSNSGGVTHRVGQQQANAWGLYDMSGNVWEWAADCYDSSCAARVLRGGSWFINPQFARAAARVRNAPAVRLNVNGFRLARTLP